MQAPPGNCLLHLHDQETAKNCAFVVVSTGSGLTPHPRRGFDLPCSSAVQSFSCLLLLLFFRVDSQRATSHVYFDPPDVS